MLYHTCVAKFHTRLKEKGRNCRRAASEQSGLTSLGGDYCCTGFPVSRFGGREKKGRWFPPFCVLALMYRLVAVKKLAVKTGGRMDLQVAPVYVPECLID
jgi:hypothetical protein